MNPAIQPITTSPYVPVFDADVSVEPRLQSLRDWWDRKRGARAMPLRSEVDPIELRPHIGSLVLIECLPELYDFRYRLIGTDIVEAYGRDSTGKTVRELYRDSDPEYHDFLLDLYRTVSQRKVSARGFGTLRPVDRDYRRFDTYLLPLAGADGETGWLLNKVLFL